MVKLIIIIMLIALVIMTALFYVCLIPYDNQIAQYNDSLKDKLKVINVYYLREVPPLKILPNGDCIDLCSAVTVKINRGDYFEIPLGVAIALPDGYTGLVFPRSSTYKRYHIIQTNSVGVIDNSYKGKHDEWHMPVIATQDTEIHAGDRICQFTVIPKNKFALKSGLDLKEDSRGGFGSTGV